MDIIKHSPKGLMCVGGGHIMHFDWALDWRGLQRLQHCPHSQLQDSPTAAYVPRTGIPCSPCHLSWVMLHVGAEGGTTPTAPPAHGPTSPKSCQVKLHLLTQIDFIYLQQWSLSVFKWNMKDCRRLCGSWPADGQHCCQARKVIKINQHLYARQGGARNFSWRQ